uniref:UspA domain-containing protein n=1 Tax=Alexandrium andersonii TaxID=327968 RepID=A0A7S2IBE6_9DINO
MAQGNSSSVIVIKDESPSLLPIGRPTKFVVSVSLNKSSTKAFLDALRLSRPGDEIHVVYIKGFMEKVDSDYTAQVREKYTAFFSGLKDGDEQVFSKFHDRVTEFVLLSKRQRETTAESVVRYADSIDADFIVVGANAADRVSRGKDPVGAVSMQICLETTRNFIVANWIDTTPAVYEAHVRRASTPQTGYRP